ncbi:AraC family transcriptional regulator [Leisingera methylohalidivorans DSM 14336]|uniref:AraC family transcriptional regulator n=2 Tax=Leisingera methylohalidivorans TaxID=133924 RepID=V9VVQ7_9RHOB|nr:AraC family transcriptional regulator [Leisingera methylohalidivorans DSM 14336]
MKSYRSFIPKSAAYFPVKDALPPRDIHFVLLPRFTMLALSSAIEPLRVANQLSQHELYRWHTVADTPAAASSCGVELNVQSSLNGLQTAGQLFVCSGTDPRNAASERTMQALRRISRMGGKIGALCTGAFTLARMGLLRDRRFTLHWENQASFREVYPDLQSSERIFEIDGPLLTCGGGHAATDMMLALITADYGKAFAQAVGDMCLHGVPRPPETPQKTSFAFAHNARNRHVTAAIEIMQRDLESPLCLDEIARECGCSRRQLERQFKKLLRTPPAKYHRNLRLDFAHSLLIETNMQLLDVAVAAGFTSRTQFSRCFSERFGTPPSKIGTPPCAGNPTNRETKQ